MNKETLASRPTTEDYLATRQGQLDSNTEKYYRWRQETIAQNTATTPEASVNDSSAESAPEVTEAASTDTELGKYYKEVVDQNEAWQTNGTDTASARELFNYYDNVDKYLQKAGEKTASVDENPEGLSLYEQAQRDKYLGDQYDEGEASLTKPSVKDENPEGLSLYEQAQRDKYLGDQYDKGETAQLAEKSKAQQELDAARLAFAKARVDVESHFFKEWFGGKKRKEALQEAADKLKACELAVAKEEMASQIEQLNQLSGEELAKQQELLAQMMAARAFQGMQETAQKTTEVYDEMLDQRFMLNEGEESKFKKVAGKVNKFAAWFKKGITKAGDKATSGSSSSQLLKLGAGGAAAGAVTAAVATWPITTAVGLGAGLVTAGVVKQSVLESHRGEERVTDNSQDAWQDVFKQGAKDAKDAGEMMESMVDTYVDSSQKSSEERQERLRRKVRSAMSKVAIGYAAGSITTGILKSTVFGAESHASGAGHDNINHASGGESTTGAEHTGSTPGVETPDGGSTAQPEVISPVGSYEYPWDWAVEQFGPENATSKLHELAEVAQANGHAIEWTTNFNGTESLTVDGIFQTDKVVAVLSQFR
mgnify:CR=1 FL=1